MFQRCLQILRSSIPRDDEMIGVVEARLSEVRKMMEFPDDAAKKLGHPGNTCDHSD
jgi:hypothetical protein